MNKAGRRPRPPRWRAWPLLLACWAACACGQTPDYRHGISLLHELKYPADFEHFEYADPDAPKGGGIVLATSLDISNFNRVRGSGLPGVDGLGQTEDKLLVRSADELSGLYGMLADGVALSPDGRILHMRLHPRARWHDGAPITTADLRFSFDEIMATVHGKVYFEPWLARLEILGPRELAFHHRGTFTNANLVALTWFPIRAAHYWRQRDTTKTTLEPPVASGPYRIADFDSSHVRYERVADYWGRDLPVNRGRYNFDTIRYDLYRDASVAREAFRKGLLDVTFESDIRHWVASYDVPAAARDWLVRGTRDVRKFIGAQRAIALNVDRPHLRDPRVREALTLALDFEWQNRALRHGSQARAQSYFANSRFAARGVPNGDELILLEEFRDRLPPRVFAEPFALPASKGYGSDRPALVRARALLAEAGWRVSGGRLRDVEGRPFTLEILTLDPTMQRVLLPYAASLARLGIEARTKLVDNTMVVNLRRARDYDAYVRELLTLNPPLGELRGLFGSRAADIELSGNIPGVRDPVVDALIERAEAASSLDEIAVACQALDRVLLWGFYHIPLQTADPERFLYWGKFGRPEAEATARYEHLVGSFVRVLDSWWFDPGKAARLGAFGK